MFGFNYKNYHQVMEQKRRKNNTQLDIKQNEEYIK